MRTGYSVSKVVAFCGLTLGLAFSGYPEGSSLQALSAPALAIFHIVAWVAVALCIVRGLPVILSPIGRELRELRRDVTAKAP